MKTSVVLFTTLMTLTFLDLALAGRGNRGRNRNGNDGCRYDRKSGQWSECDPTTNKMTKTMSLKNGQPSTCDPTKTVHRPCSKACKYERGDWSECDQKTGKKTVIRKLASGSNTDCPPTITKERPCAARKGRQKGSLGRRTRLRNKTYTCKYVTGNWSECDDVTSTHTVTLTLKKGDPLVCGETKLLTKPCEVNAVGCEYERKVSDCVDNKRTITFTLISGPDSCPQKEPKEKPCGRPGKNKNRKEKKAERKARRQERRNNRNNGGEP